MFYVVYRKIGIKEKELIKCNSYEEALSKGRSLMDDNDIDLIQVSALVTLKKDWGLSHGI